MAVEGFFDLRTKIIRMYSTIVLIYNSTSTVDKRVQKLLRGPFSSEYHLSVRQLSILLCSSFTNWHDCSLKKHRSRIFLFVEEIKTFSGHRGKQDREIKLLLWD